MSKALLKPQNYWIAIACTTLIVIIAMLLLPIRSYTSRSACPPINPGPLDELGFVNVATQEKGFPFKYYYGYKVTPAADCSEFKNTFLPISFTADVLIFALPGGAISYLLRKRHVASGANKK